MPASISPTRVGPKSNSFESYPTAASQVLYGTPCASHARSSQGSPRVWNSAKRVGLFTYSPSKILWIIAMVIACLILSSIWRKNHGSAVSIKHISELSWSARPVIKDVSLRDYRSTVQSTSQIPTAAAITHLSQILFHFSPRSQLIIATLTLLIPLPLISTATHAIYHPSTCIQLSLHCAPIERTWCKP